ncbi:DUF1566 domain-containing protein [Oxalobacteraceae bacterium A2-2]
MSKAQFMSENLRPGELYAGLLLGADGQPDQHIFLLPGAAEKLTWDQAKEWAAKAGGELPTRREQSLLFANLKSEFQAGWYWSGEQHVAYPAHAWLQYFSLGNQLYDHKSYAGRVRAVRRLAI